ncbi:hypothetical protein PAXINDRAFT_18694 [Paxillus involutus ATCC 200175]|uniref:Uncharacterized protein n=1 Tax=Paxillus involutus ATCC 200175 TaxID=664439 RepID=A0A0C9TAQ0_PAXIN|nr:hypothetical protein PAXINDRAFT_18694 [Paxillus involutus ATCC 200175]
MLHPEVFQKPRGAEGHDPPNPTSSVFIPSETVTQMEVHVERCRSKGKERGRRVLHPSEDEDRVEEGMRVPALVLNGCGESFVAADEKREKASTHFFADTELMALLCRHDHVLWLVNMTSAGEKQHYALVLIFYRDSISLSRSFMPMVINGPVRWCTILGNGKGQLKHKADEEISKIIELEKLVGAHAQMVRSLELRFISNQVHDVESFEIKIADARSQHNNLLETLRRRREGLGVTGRAKLVALDRLHQRKFELERIERAYRQMVGDQRLHSHAEASVKHHEPTLLQLKAVHGAVMPHYIPQEDLFELDVDDDIWQDVGLTGDEAEPPAWLADDKVQVGI